MFLNGQSSEAFILIHGGAGPMDPSSAWVHHATELLHEIASPIARTLQNIENILEPVCQALLGMENTPDFNAGFGSALQADGQARLSASVMHGKNQSFSAVMAATMVKNPSKIAQFLQTRSSRVLTQPGVDILARQMQLAVEDLRTAKRIEQWYKKLADEHSYGDTVGAIVYHPLLGLAAGTSTGGRGFEFPGRISDSATVAGNYASEFAAISATGIGEEITDDALCARLETRRRDGMSLEEASKKCFDEALANKRSYGWIAADKNGHWSVAFTTEAMSYLAISCDLKLLASSYLASP